MTEPTDPRAQTAQLGAIDAPGGERTLPSTETTRTQQTPPPRADLARSVAAQMATAVSQSSDGSIDVRLMPEDLGRVRLALTPGDLGMTVNITTERPETLDLVRRHIDMFAQDLRQNGFQNLAFTFGQDQRSAARPSVQTATPDAAEMIDDVVPATVSPQSRPAGTGRLDIRL
ncbi:MAG: flagellar hook-length control protein FliK [Pseudomonadota bacterium]